MIRKKAGQNQSPPLPSKLRVTGLFLIWSCALCIGSLQLEICNFGIFFCHIIRRRRLVYLQTGVTFCLIPSRSATLNEKPRLTRTCLSNRIWHLVQGSLGRSRLWNWANLVQVYLVKIQVAIFILRLIARNGVERIFIESVHIELSY